MDIKFLKYYLQDPKHSIEVYDLNSDSKLHKPKRIFQTYLDEKHNGSIEEYFKSLVKKGIDKVQVQMMRKQGNTDVRYKTAKNLQINQNSNAVNVGSGEASLAGSQQGSESHITQKPMETSTMGMNAQAKAFWYDKLDRENDNLKNELKQAYKEIERKKDEIRDLKLEQVANKSNFMDNITRVLENNPGLLEKVIPSGGGQQQLPQGMQGASAVTSQLVAFITQNDLPDELVERLIFVAQIYAMNKGVLINQIQKALDVHIKELQKQNQQQNGTS